MADLEPTGEKVYDPNLGKERDAFPGEIIPPEQEKTLNRVMRGGEEEFRKVYEAVAKTGRLTTEELNAVLKAGKINAEIKRQEYLKAIRENPANIISEIFRGFKPGQNLAANRALRELDGFVQDKTRILEIARATDKTAGRDIKPTQEYAEQVLRDFDSRRMTVYSRTNFNITEGFNDSCRKLLIELDALPSEDIKSISQLVQSVLNSNNTSDSGKPYLQSGQKTDFIYINNLSAQRPGLEGVYINFTYDGFLQEVVSLNILCGSTTLTRIVDRGQYVPYKDK